jgi:hypothetical protein
LGGISWGGRIEIFNLENMKTTKKTTQYQTGEQIVKKKLDEANYALSKTDLSKLLLKNS